MSTSARRGCFFGMIYGLEMTTDQLARPGPLSNSSSTGLVAGSYYPTKFGYSAQWAGLCVFAVGKRNQWLASGAMSEAERRLGRRGACQRGCGAGARAVAKGSCRLLCALAHWRGSNMCLQ